MRTFIAALCLFVVSATLAIAQMPTPNHEAMRHDRDMRVTYMGDGMSQIDVRLADGTRYHDCHIPADVTATIISEFQADPNSIKARTSNQYMDAARNAEKAARDAAREQRMRAAPMRHGQPQ